MTYCPMAGAIEVEARLWEWQSIQGAIFVVPVCAFWGFVLASIWTRLTPLLIVIFLLETTLIPLIVGLLFGLYIIPRSASLSPDMVYLKFYSWTGKTRTLELPPDKLGELRILPFGWFGSSLINKDRRGKMREVSLTKCQTRLLESKVRRMSWLKG